MINQSTLRNGLLSYPKLAALMLGGGLGTAFIWPMAMPIACIAILLSLDLIERLDQTKLPSTLMIFFGAKALVSLVWFWYTYPIVWLFELAPSTQLIAIFLYWVTAALWLSTAGIVLALLWRVFSFWCSRIYLLPLLWVVAEYLGAVVFSLLTIGPGAYITGAFSFGHIGYLFVWLAPLAQWGGVYGVGIFGLYGIVMVYQFLRTKQKGVAIISMSVMIGLYGVSDVMLSENKPDTAITLVNTTFDSSVAAEERQKALGEMVASALATESDYILLPEDARYLYAFESQRVGAQVAIEAWQILHATKTPIMIDSGRTPDQSTGQAIQRAYIWGNGNNIYTAEKQYLVPQGEYMPTLYTFLLRVAGLQEVADTLTETINYRSSNRVVEAHAPASIPNILFCFESVSPLAAKRLVQQRPSDFIVHPMSHSWFHTPTMLWRQLDSMLRFQAIYAQTPIVSVGNEVAGKLYLPTGQVVVPRTVAAFPYGSIDTFTMDI
ncbi:MAG: Apolipoprotein N-acyltransferase [Candidatus Parcubacteria bacterium]|jgi:apolipoprotein N-acyltransferase